MWKIRLTPFEPFPPTTLLRPLLLSGARGKAASGAKDSPHSALP